MLHHASLGVSDIERSAAFYDAALGALGYVRVWDDIRPGQTGQAVGMAFPAAATSWRSNIGHRVRAQPAQDFIWLLPR
ncbi:UNVERIFIED_ORG: catechol 2,3-dioxygenase-like lactoylglutathione lyase family enzyme [Rhizobium esperanzae]